jgi:hypothetical protein
MGQSYFEAIAEDMDRQGIIAAAEMAKDLIVQYFTDLGAYPNIQRIFEGATGETIASLTSKQKEELLLGDWDTKAKGLALWFERKEQINKLARHNDFLARIPPEIALNQVDWKTMGEAWCEAIWGDPTKFWKWTPNEGQQQIEQPQQIGGPQGELAFEEEGTPQTRLPYGSA